MEQLEGENQQKEETSKRHTYPLIRVMIYLIQTHFILSVNGNFLQFQNSDMHDEMKTEAMELCVTACEKFASNNEVNYFIR